MQIKCAYTDIVDSALLVPNPRNPNKHPDEQIKLLAKIMKHQGWRSPIVVSKRSGFITKGHGRLLAARLNGWDKAPVDTQEYKNEADEYADMVADNKIAELAETDMAMVGEIVLGLGNEIDLELLGIPDFKVEEIDLPELASGDKPEFQQMTFTLHDDQAEQVRYAIELSKSMGAFIDTPNENSNGNALARICETFVTQNG